jgi:hypothetical protein
MKTRSSGKKILVKYKKIINKQISLKRIQNLESICKLLELQLKKKNLEEQSKNSHIACEIENKQLKLTNLKLDYDIKMIQNESIFLDKDIEIKNRYKTISELKSHQQLNLEKVFKSHDINTSSMITNLYC